MTEYRMPSLGADMESGVVYEWRVKPGDPIKRGDVIASVETEKGVIDIEVFEEAVMGEILVQPGTRVPVGAVLAMIHPKEEAVAPATDPALLQAAVGAVAESHPSDQPPPIQPRPVQLTPARNGKRLRVSPAARKRAAELGLELNAVQGTGPDGAITLADVEQAETPEGHTPVAPEREKIRVSPVARRMAEELSIDLRLVKGTGPHGAISRADVERAAAEAIRRQQSVAVTPPSPAEPPAPARPESADFQAGMRRAIAKAMARSNREIPHYYLETRVDMTRALRWLEAENLKRSISDRILPVVLLVKATARALVDVPQLNGYWQDDQLQVQEAIHIGFAIALRQGGLVTPAIHHADSRSLDELMGDVRDVITRTRSGRLRSSELMDATITLTNLGDVGVEKVYGVIYPPQVALVGFGKVVEQPWAENGMLGVRPILTATLAGDHRATDGRIGAQFLVSLDKHLQEPEKL